MSLSYWLFPDLAAYKGLQSLDNRLETGLRLQHQKSLSLEQRCEGLERDLARITMLARALAELGLSRGAFTREELERALVEADLADGERDGGLDPGVALPGAERTVDLEPLDGPPGGGA